jgi:O-antigen ligase
MRAADSWTAAPGIRIDSGLLWVLAATCAAAVLLWFLPSASRMLFILTLGAAGFALVPVLWREGYTWIVLWLAPVASFDPLPTAGVRAAKYLLIALAIAIAISKRRLIPRAKGTWEKGPVYFTLILFAWLWVRALSGGAPFDGAVEALRLSAVAGLSYLWLSEPGRAGGRKRWYYLWMTMGIYQVAVCVIEATFFGSVRSYGTFPNANAMGTFLIPTIALAAAVSSCAPTKASRTGAFALLPLLLFALYLTVSRAALLATLVTLLSIIVIARKWRVMVAVALVMIVAIGYYSTHPLFRYSVDTTFRLQSGLTHRPILWEAADRAWSRAMIVGYGLEAGGEEMDRAARYLSAEHRAVASELVQAGSPHNFYREMLLETGLIGLALVLLAVASLVRIGWRTRHSSDPWRKAYALALLGVTPGILVHSYFERSVLLGSMSSAVFYWFLAVQMLRADDPAD